MPNVSFFGGGYRDAARGATIKALEERQKAADAALLASMQPRQINHPLQGVADVLGTVGAGIREARAENQAASARDQLAKLLAGGLTPDEYGQAMGLDPELTGKYISHDWDTQAAKDRVAAEKEAAAARVQAEQDAQTKLFAEQEKQKGQEHGYDVETAATLAKTQAAQKIQDAALSDPVAAVKLAQQSGYLSPEEAKAREDAINAKAAREGMMPAQQQVDQNFAKDYVDWNTAGRGNVERQLTEVKKTLELLNDPKSKGYIYNITGPNESMIPDFARPYLNPQGIIAEESIRDAVQNTLKATLGSQFTAGEGERLMNRAFNRVLPPEENARRAKLIFDQLGIMAKQKQAMVDYYGKNQTLNGYTGPRLDMTLFDNLDFGDSGAGTGGGAAGAGAGAGGGAPDLSGYSDDDLKKIVGGQK